MSAFTVGAGSDVLEAPEAEVNASPGLVAQLGPFLPEAPSFPVLVDEEAPARVAETVGIRLACSRIVRWQHGGINE